MSRREIGIDLAKWVLLAQDTVQWRAFMHCDEPSGSIKKAGCFLTS
jgi:hypothetical protein